MPKKNLHLNASAVSGGTKFGLGRSLRTFPAETCTNRSPGSAVAFRCKVLGPNGTLVWYSYAIEILVALVPVWKKCYESWICFRNRLFRKSFFLPPKSGVFIGNQGVFLKKSDSPVLWDTYPFKWYQRRFVWIAYGPEIQPFYWKEPFYDRWRNATNHPTPDRALNRQIGK
jgi:hypothetical protein